MHIFSSSPSDQIKDLWYDDCMDEEALQLICVVDCPDCDTTVLTDPYFVSIFIGFGDITAISMCGYCERPVSCVIDNEFAKELVGLGVKIFSWETGCEVGIKEITS